MNRRTYGLACLISLMASTVALSQTAQSDEPGETEAFPYRYSLVASLPLYPGGSEGYSALSIGKTFSKSWFPSQPDLRQSIRIGFLLSTFRQVELSIDNNYSIIYTALDIEKTLFENLGASPLRMTLIGGVGVGSSHTLQIIEENGYLEERYSGLGYIASAGVRLERAGLLAELRTNVYNGGPSFVITANAGYQSRTAFGIVKLPVFAAAVFGVVFLILLVSGNLVLYN